MGNRPTSVVLVTAAWMLGACGAADNRVDPGDLSLRDLLGIAPHVAAAWDDGQRAAARHVVAEAMADAAEAADAEARALASGRTRGERIARTLAAADGSRAGAGAGALPLVRLAVEGVTVESAARRAAGAAMVAVGGEPAARGGAAVDLGVELWLSPAWDEEPRWSALPGRGLDVVAALARDAGHTGGPVIVVPAPRLAVAAAYVVAGETPAELMINPVVLAALEPDPLEGANVAALSRPPMPGAAGSGAGERAAGGGGPGGAGGAAPGAVSVDGTGGNPYSFYGSVAECAYAQRTRCELCLASSNCAAVTDTTDGNGECTMLGADGGRGYFLLCINLSLAIASVDACVADEAPSCPRDSDAASKLAELASNASFLDDATCALALDTCLADIYGAPPNPFPGTDGGTVPPDPPRDIDISCGDSCDADTNNGNTDCSPSCGGGSGPSCNNAFSCDSACSSSNEQSGCGGNCEACSSSSDSGGSTSGGCGGCDSEGSTGDSGGSCGSCDDSGSTGGGSGCGSSDSGGSSGCGDCGSSDSGGSSSGCGDCGSSSSGGSSSGCGDCSSGGGGGGSSCNVARRGPPASAVLLIALMWGLLPIPAALLVRRRARRRRGASPPTPDAPAGDAPVGEEVRS